jgi:hypothetical protein
MRYEGAPAPASTCLLPLILAVSSQEQAILWHDSETIHMAAASKDSPDKKEKAASWEVSYE